MSASGNVRKRPHETMSFSQPSAVENQVSRVFRASPERVFHLFTDVATIPYVFARDPRTVTVEKLEFRTGGKYSIQVMQEGGKSVRIFGEFLEVVPPRRVVNTFAVDTAPESSAVETDIFEPEGDFTRVTIRWKFQRPEDRAKMGGPEQERVLTAMWDNVEVLLEKLLTESADAEVAP